MNRKFPKRVALLSPGWPLSDFPNGIVSYVNGLQAGLASQGVETCILAARSTAPAENVIDLNTEAGNLPLSRKLLYRLAYRLAARRFVAIRLGLSVSSALKNGPAATAQILEMEESFGVSRFIQPRRLPVIVRLHGPWFLNGPASGVPSDKQYHTRCADERSAILTADAVSAPSRFVLEAVRDEMGPLTMPTAVIPNPCPPVEPDRRWNPTGINVHTILYVGRFERIKGSDVLFLGFEKVVEEIPDAELLFVGPDVGLRDDQGVCWDLPQYLKQKVSPKAAARVTVFGPVGHTEIEALRLRSALTVISSRQENLPLAAIEAASYGCPLVASDAGGLPEVVEHGRNGLLFLNGHGADLAEKILSLLNDPELAARLGRQAAEDAARFHPHRVARQTLEFYARLNGS